MSARLETSRRASRRRARCRRTENTGAEQPSARGGVGDRQTAPTPPAPRPRDQRRSTAPKLPTTQGRRRRQPPAATSAAPAPEQPASVAGGRGQRGGAAQRYEQPRTATATAPRAARRTSATPPETSPRRSRPRPESRRGGRHKHESRRTKPRTTPRNAPRERHSPGSYNPNHRSTPKSVRQPKKISRQRRTLALRRA